MRPLLLLGGLGAAAAAIYLFEKNASAAPAHALPPAGAQGSVTAQGSLPPLTLPAATNGTITTSPVVITGNPAPIPNNITHNGDFTPVTFAAATALDALLLASGCPHAANGIVAGFQQAYQTDPKGGQLIGGVDGLYGPSTQTALSQVIGTTNVVPGCHQDNS